MDTTSSENDLGLEFKVCNENNNVHIGYIYITIELMDDYFIKNKMMNVVTYDKDIVSGICSKVNIKDRCIWLRQMPLKGYYGFDFVE